MQNQLNTEQESAASSQERLKQLRTELNQERARATQQKRAVDELTAQQTAEAARTAAQEQRLRTELQQLQQQAQQQAQQLQESSQLQLHQAVAAERMLVQREWGGRTVGRVGILMLSCTVRQISLFDWVVDGGCR